MTHAGTPFEYYFVRDSEKKLNRTPPHLKDFDSNSKENYYDDLEYNESSVKEKFLKLVTKIFNSLEKNNVTVDQLKRFSRDYFVTIEGWDRNEVDSEFREADSFDAIHKVMNKHYSFYNFGLIENLVNSYSW